MEKVKNLYRTARAQNDSINTSEQIRTTCATFCAPMASQPERERGQCGTEHAGQGPGPRGHRIRPSPRALRSAGRKGLRECSPPTPVAWTSEQSVLCQK